MKLETVKTRLAKDRPMVSVTVRMPADVVEDLKRIAPLRGCSGYQSLLRAYVGAGLREDLERFEGSPLTRLIDKLREEGVDATLLAKAAAAVAEGR